MTSISLGEVMVKATKRVTGHFVTLNKETNEANNVYCWTHSLGQGLLSCPSNHTGTGNDSCSSFPRQKQGTDHSGKTTRLMRSPRIH